MILLHVLGGSLLAFLLTFSVVWIVHESALFDPLMSIIEAHGGFFSEMVACRECFSVWSSAWAALVVMPLTPASGIRVGTAYWITLWLSSTAMFHIYSKVFK